MSELLRISLALQLHLRSIVGLYLVQIGLIETVIAKDGRQLDCPAMYMITFSPKEIKRPFLNFTFNLIRQGKKIELFPIYL